MASETNAADRIALQDVISRHELVSRATVTIQGG